MTNDEIESLEEGATVEAQEPAGPKIIVMFDENDEVQIATKDGSIHPRMMIHMLDVAKAKMEMYLFNMLLRQQQEAQARSNIVLARPDVRGLDI